MMINIVKKLKLKLNTNNKQKHIYNRYITFALYSYYKYITKK